MANNQPSPGARSAPATPPPPPQATPPYPPRPGRAVRSGNARTILAAVLGGLIGSLLTVAALSAAGVFSEPDPVTTTTTTVSVEPATAEVTVPIPIEGTTAVAVIAELVRPSIVTVEVGNGNGADASPAGTGSGVIYSEDGYVLTNNHVVQDTEFVRVVFLDGRIYQAEVVGTDPLTDVAVIKVAAPNLKPIELANIADVRIGDPAIAIGNPLGLRGGPSVTSGIVSAFNRTLTVTAAEELFGLIQTDAPITRGSSGGALLDGQGRLIGITTAIGVSDVGAEGLGFAVPVNIVVGVAEDLIANGEVNHAFLGIVGENAFELTDDNARLPTGARIASIEPGSAIGAAGAQAGDTIVTLDGAPIANMNELVAMLRTHRAGDTVEVGLLRDDETITVSVILDRRPDDT
ncbi:MAG: S1C family serine protease [Acidimicrobiia bacterium]